jgi:hypothetical protein
MYFVAAVFVLHGKLFSGLVTTWQMPSRKRLGTAAPIEPSCRKQRNQLMQTNKDTDQDKLIARTLFHFSTCLKQSAEFRCDV